MKVVVCIGSSCHLKGSREVVEKLQNLINDNDLKDKVTLSGKFCMGNCQNGVSVTVDGELFSVSVNNTFYKVDSDFVAGKSYHSFDYRFAVAA